MSTQPHKAFASDRERHLAAVARSLKWAEESAHGDYADAFSWIQTVEAIQTAGLNIGV